MGELIVLLGAAVAAAGAVAAYYASSRTSTRLWLKRQRRHRVHLFPDGATGVIEGTVSAPLDNAILRAPLSARACVGYQLLIETSVDWHAHGWVLAHSEAACSEFVVTDGDASARVEASTEVIVIAEQRIWNANEGNDTRMREILEERSILQKRALTEPLRMIEEMVCVEQIVAVAGRGDREADALGEDERLYRDTPTRLVIRPHSAAHPLLLIAPPSRGKEVRERSMRPTR